MENKKTDRANLTPDEIAAAEKALAEAKAKAKAAKEQADKAAAQKKVAEEQAAKKTLAEAKANELPELIEQGRKAYPSNRTFYLTSDNQLFLADARNLALLHQRSLKSGEVQTFEV